MSTAPPPNEAIFRAIQTESRPLRQLTLGDATAEQFHASFGEELRQVLDVTTWGVGADLSREFTRIEREIREAVEHETDYQRQIRDVVFPRLEARPEAPRDAGVHQASAEQLTRIQRGLLFNGGVECCDGTMEVHDTLPLTVYQVGVSLVSYRGDQGTWSQRLFRRDLRQQCADPVAEVLELLERRSRREAAQRGVSDDPLGELVRKTLLDYAERAVLLRRSQAAWRLGHGNLITYELLTGAGLLELMVAGTQLLRELIQGHQKFIFVASEPRDRMLLTIGQALRPLEYAIVETLADSLHRWFSQERFKVGIRAVLDWDGQPLTPADWIPRFIDEVASQVVVGIYRASAYAPAQLFYAHVDHARLAPEIVLADGMLQEHRGLPLLIDLANHVCRSVFRGTLQGLSESAYAAAGVPWRYFSERSTRSR
jgi:hypothetical protein